MNKTTAKKILEKFIKFQDWKYDRFDTLGTPDALEAIFSGYVEDVKQMEGFHIDLEERFGGEGYGEKYWNVFSLKKTNTEEVFYIKFDGWYNSHSGAEFDKEYMVEPEEVKVIQWKKRKAKRK